MKQLLLAMLLMLLPRLAAATESQIDTRSIHGTTAGLIEQNPEWSLGVQLGNYGATGIVAQKVGFLDGALNLGLGLNFDDMALQADYLVFLTEDWDRLHLPKTAGYNAFRGHLNPYFGGGVGVGRGFALRLPFGLQYTMVKDPFNFYGGLVLVVGRFFTDERVGPQLWFNLGARILL